jgi:hypothetical protein
MRYDAESMDHLFCMERILVLLEITGPYGLWG